MHKFSRPLIFMLLLACSGTSLATQNFWQDVTASSKLLIDEETTSIRYYDSDEQALRNFLALVPNELAGDDSYTILLPMPDGTQESYSIVESPIMEAALAAKYPEIKTFKVYGIDDLGASGRVDITANGFHAMLQTTQGMVFLDPDPSGMTFNRYQSRSREAASASQSYRSRVDDHLSNRSSLPMSSNKLAYRVPGNYLEYRLAVSATQEYVIAVKQAGTLLIDTVGLLADAETAIATAVNRINQIYERDLGIRLVLVGNNDLLIDVDGTSDLAGLNNNGFVLLTANQTWIDNTIGVASYDIGHVFSTGGGGVASIESVCDNSTSLDPLDAGTNAQGVTGLPNPTGDLFYIDFVSHEIGHQFGSEHSFNGTEVSCAGFNRNALTAFEPGSGSTIMAYAGICGLENIQNSSDATFHAGSILQINSFVESVAGSCNTLASASNPNEPTADAGVDQNIPVNTPFKLVGIGTDLDTTDALSYQWDQMDAGTATDSTTIGDDLGDNALFRTYPPQPTGGRDFPALGTQVRDGPYDQSETLPCTARDMNFRLTVRDGKSGQATDDIQVVVDNTAGPFRITSFDSAQTINTNSGSFILNWDVANTDSGTVNCPNVDVDLLTFGANYTEYSATSLGAKLNNGNALLTFPDPTKSSSLARLRVKCSNNIFYDISDADLVINGTGVLPTDVYSTSDNQTFFNTNGQLFATSSSCNVATAVSAGGGGGSFNIPWIIFLLSLTQCIRLIRSQKGDIFKAGSGS